MRHRRAEELNSLLCSTEYHGTVSQNQQGFRLRLKHFGFLVQDKNLLRFCRNSPSALKLGAFFVFFWFVLAVFLCQQGGSTVQHVNSHVPGGQGGVSITHRHWGRATRTTGELHAGGRHTGGAAAAGVLLALAALQLNRDAVNPSLVEHLQDLCMKTGCSRSPTLIVQVRKHSDMQRRHVPSFSQFPYVSLVHAQHAGEFTDALHWDTDRKTSHTH